MNRYLFLLIVLLLLAMPVIAQDSPTPPQVGARNDAPTYALHGPYWVGTRTLEFNVDTPDYRRFTIWYPALNPEGLEEATIYQMSKTHTLHDLISPDREYTVIGHALENAAPDLSGAPYPLVINSHAFTAEMWQMYLGEHLASYGFFVIAPEHRNDSWDNVYTDVVIRMGDVIKTIQDAETMTAPGGLMQGMIDVDKIAVGGHSAGGMTTYGAAGAPVNWEPAQAFCDAYPEDMNCFEMETQHQQIIDLLNGDGLELMPVEWDERIDAIFPMAGSTELHGEKGLQAVTVPMLAMFGSDDYAFSLYPPAYDYVSSTQKAQVIFEKASHGIFYQPCDVFPYLDTPEMFWACSDPVWDLHRAQDLTNHFVTAFLLDVLKGDADAHAALSPGAVNFPGIQYKAHGF